MLRAIFCFGLSDTPLSRNPFLQKSFFLFLPLDRIQYDPAEPVAFFRPASERCFRAVISQEKDNQAHLVHILRVILHPAQSFLLWFFFV
jgi:hypothetical protein